MPDLTLTVLDERFAIHRLPPSAAIPEEVYSCSFYTVTRTADELSIICPQSTRIKSARTERGWACLKVLGPIEFDAIGVLAGICSVLASAEKSVFAVSTYDTDYILVKSHQLKAVLLELKRNGYRLKR
jgi:hypothetical protein